MFKGIFKTKKGLQIKYLVEYKGENNYICTYDFTLPSGDKVSNEVKFNLYGQDIKEEDVYTMTQDYFKYITDKLIK